MLINMHSLATANFSAFVRIHYGTKKCSNAISLFDKALQWVSSLLISWQLERVDFELNEQMHALKSDPTFHGKMLISYPIWPPSHRDNARKRPLWRTILNTSNALLKCHLVAIRSASYQKAHQSRYYLPSGPTESFARKQSTPPYQVFNCFCKSVIISKK